MCAQNWNTTAVATSWMRALTASGRPREHQPEHDAAQRDHEQRRQHAPAGHEAGDRGADREAVDEQRARVVEEALSLEDHEQPVRRAELLEHRGGGRRVRRRDDGAERDRGRPRHVGDEQARDDGDDGDRERDGAEGEARDRAPVRAQVARRGVERGVDQHGRDEQRERELGIEHERRHAGDERERGAGERHQRRVRRADPPGQGGERRAAQQQRDDDLEYLHGCLRSRSHHTRRSCRYLLAQAPGPSSGYDRSRPVIGQPLSRRDALRLFGVSAVTAAFSRRARAQELPPPNVLFVMTDDQRKDTLSAYGNTILRTPNMDRIANGGIRFEEAFVTNSLCAPSRASVLTGLYSHAHGVVTNGDGPQFYNGPGLRPDQPTWVDLLHEAGYHTGLVGKWHLKSQPRGFDEWVIFPWQGDYQDPEMVAKGVPLRMRGHADDVVGDQALEFLRRRPIDRPFCLLYQFKSPHRTWKPAPRYAAAFEGVDIPVPRTFEDRLAGRPEAVRAAEMALADMPDYRDRVPASLPPEERKRRNLELMVKDYYRVLLSVDENLGRVLDFLDEQKLTPNTLVVYTSDNGFFLGEHGLFDKRLMYEPSIRVPLAIRYPARFAAATVDRTHMVLNVDVMPTILQLAGIPVPPNLHGRSAVPLLEGADVPWRDDFLYEYYEYPAGHCVRKNRGVRTARWKLIQFFEQPEEWELYDLENDPDETRNLAGDARFASVMSTLRARLGELRRELGDSDPPGPAPRAQTCRDGQATGWMKSPG